MTSPQPRTPLRMAAIGAGWVSTNRHLPAMHGDPGVDLRAILVPKGELDAAARQALVQRFGPLEFPTSLDDPSLDDVDAVMIGTPPDTHPELVIAALESGKHVLVEKPFAMTTADADKMLAAAAANDRQVCVVHNMQFGAASARARELVAKGAIGEVRGVFGVQSSNHERRLPSWYKTLPLGLFTDEAPHLIYLLQAFLPGSDLESLYVGRPLAGDDLTPDLVSMVFRDGDVVGSLQMTFVGPLSEWLLVIQGTEATVVVDIFRDVCVTVPNDHGHLAVDVIRTQLRTVGGHLLGTLGAGTKRLRGNMDYGNAVVVRRFVEAVRTGIADPYIDGTRGREVVAVMEASHQAATPAPRS